MIPECEFASTHALAREMRETADLVSGLDLSPRPWNRFEPENTRWWFGTFHRLARLSSRQVVVGSDRRESQYLILRVRC